MFVSLPWLCTQWKSRAVFTCNCAETSLLIACLWCQISQLSLWVGMNFLWTPDRDGVPADEPSAQPPPTLLWVGGPLQCVCMCVCVLEGVVKREVRQQPLLQTNKRAASLSKSALQGIFTFITVQLFFPKLHLISPFWIPPRTWAESKTGIQTSLTGENFNLEPKSVLVLSTDY